MMTSIAPTLKLSSCDIVSHPLAVRDEQMNTAGLLGRVLFDEPMSAHTSWRVGGPADLFYRAHDENDLLRFVRQLPATMNVEWIGLGSNLLVRDGGIRGAVLGTHQALSTLERVDDTTLRVASGVACAKLARTAARFGLQGAAFFAGIPGTLGGALAMNAGAFGGETWEVVSSVEVVDRNGQRRRLMAADFEVGYRSVRSAHLVDGKNWFLGADIRLQQGDAAAAKDRIKQLLAQRSQTQPVQSFNAGSVFRNPPGRFAAQLIETSGLKGLAVGGASVSEQHANFIINRGDATAADIEQLIETVAERVFLAHGVRLQTEVRIIGVAAEHDATAESTC